MLHDRTAAPGLEFALIAPVMFGMLAGSYDVTQLLIANRKVMSTAQQIVEIATEQSVQPDQSNALTIQQGYQAQTTIYALIPGLKSGNDKNQFSVTLSTVVFAAIPPGCRAGQNCAYVANTAWSITLPQGLQALRPCGVVPQVAPTQPATMLNLPTAGMTALTSMVVADVYYYYQPLFTGYVVGPVTLHRTAFLPPRAGTPNQYVQYDLAHPIPNASICPGYH